MEEPSRDDAAVFAAFVIADIRGYTRFTREQGDSAAARLTRRLADLADDAIEARGGRVYELRGDEVACVFDSAAQAVRGALDLLALCADEQAKDPSLPLAVGAGVDAGPTVPLGDGYRGTALNTAARLCSQAAAGQVLVSESVSSLLGGHDDVTFQGRGEAVLKGFDDPMNLTEVTWRNPPHDRVAEPGPGGRASVPPPAAIGWETASTLVGREHELRWLRGSWWQARRGRGRLIVVDGAHQMGKTRLVAQLAELVEQRGEDVVYVGLGGTAAADARRALDRAPTASGPLLVILDDVDGLGEAVVPRVLDVAAQINDRPVLVVCTTTSVTSVPTLWAARGQFDEHEDGYRSLAPLTAADVRAIGTEYVGSDVDELPVDAVLASTHGVPGQVHEVISAWAAGEASRRLAAAGEWLASGRSRHSDDITFANNVIARRLERIYGSDDTLDLAPGSCPYMGLASFGADDASIFFGREQLVGELAARTVGSGLLAVVGPSGAGKSSVIAAGLVPSLHAGLLPGSTHWRSVSLRPGGHPVDALLDALARPNIEAESSRTIVVIDQFEEIFTHGIDESARATFVNAIVDLAHDPEHYVVVLGIRGDHYAHVAPYKELATLMAGNTVLVGPMSREELRRAIEWPARRSAVRLEAQLVDALVEDFVARGGRAAAAVHCPRRAVVQPRRRLAADAAVRADWWCRRRSRPTGRTLVLATDRRRATDGTLGPAAARGDRRP
jgi:class 3 adenylate cyclase